MHKVRLRKLDGTDEIVEIPGIQRALHTGGGWRLLESESTRSA